MTFRGKKEKARAEHSYVLLFFFLNDGYMYLQFLHEESIAWKKSMPTGLKCGQSVL